MGHHELTLSLVRSVYVLSLKVYLVIGVSAWLLGKHFFSVFFPPMVEMG